MKRLIAFLASTGGSRAALCCLWLFLGLGFAYLALEAHADLTTTLPRSGFRMPLTHNIPVGNLRLQEVVNDLAQKHDATAAQLETAIRHSARTSLMLHLTAALLSGLGFGLQCWQLRLAWLDPEGMQARSGVVPVPLIFGSIPGGVTKVHDGSFPEGGYAG
jgi:hypothetical protein